MRPARIYLICFVGAALVILGTLRNWVSVPLRGDANNPLTPHWLGIDVPEGRAVAVLAVLSLAGVVWLGLSAMSGRRTWILAAISTASAACLTIAIVDAAGALHRYGTQGLHDIAVHYATQLHEPVDLVLARLKATNSAYSSSQLGSGLWLTMVGAAILGAGSVLAILQARAPRVEPQEEPVQG